MASIASKRPGLPVAIFVAAAGYYAGAAHAQDATWLTAPASNNFDSAANWSPAAVPTGTAFFNTSNTTSIAGGAALGTLQFNSGASAFTFTGGFKLDGAGIVNTSSSTQTFNVSDALSFQNGAIASNAVINNSASAVVTFQNTSSASFAHITNLGSVIFNDSSTAGSAVIGNANGAVTQFANNSTAGNAAIGVASGGLLLFTDNATGGSATIGGTAGGVVDFSGTTGAAGNNQVTAGAIAGGGQFNLGGTQLTVGSTNASTTVSGVIVDGGSSGGTGASLVKVGTGTLTLTGADTYTGPTAIEGGTLALGPGGSISSTSAVNLAVSGVSFDISGSGNQTILDFLGVAGSSVVLGANLLTVGTANSTSFAGVISGTGGLIKNGTGTLFLAGANTYSGGTTLNAGILNISADNNLGAANGALTFNGGELQFGASFNLANTRPITVNANSVIDTNGFNTTITQVITGSGGLIKIGAGSLSLTGANTFTGGVTFNAGTIVVQANTDLGTGTVTMANGTILQAAANNLTFANQFVLNGGSETVDTQANLLTLSGVISGTGGITKIGTGTLTLTGADLATGVTTVNAGTLALGVGGSISSTALLNLAAAGATLDMSGSGNQTIINVAGVGGSSIVLGANTLTAGSASSTTFGGVISGTGGLIKIGTGTFALTGANTFTGGTQLNVGTLGVGNNAALGTGALTMTGGTVLQAVAGGLSLGNAIALTGVETIDTQGNALTLGGVLSGGGTLIKAGTGTLFLAGTDTFTGGVAVVGGTLALDAAGTLVATTGVNLAVAGTAFDISLANGNRVIGDLSGVAGTTVNLGINSLTEGNGGATTFAGTITGTGGLTIAGGGSLALVGANTYSGGTTVNSGVLIVDNNAALGTGALTLDDTTTLQAGVNNLVIGNAITLQGAVSSTAETIDTLGNFLSLTGTISGGGELLKGGSGPLFLTGANTYAGGTELISGTIAVSNNASLSTGLLTMDGGTTLQAAANGLSLANAVALVGANTVDTQFNNFNLTGIVSGTGSLIKIGFGTLTLTGVNTYSGGTALLAGTLAVADNSALGTGALTMSGGTTLAASAAVLTLNNAIAFTGGETVNTQGNSLTLAGVISGGGNLTVIGGGSLALTGANTFSGGTALNTGTLGVGNNSALGTGLLAMASGTTLQADAAVTLGNAITLAGFETVDTQNNLFTLAGPISGFGSLNKIGTGTLVLSGANTYFGATNVNVRGLAIGAGGSISLSSGVFLNALGTSFDISGGGNQTIQDLFGVAGSAVTLGANTLTEGTFNSTTFAGVISGTGALTKINGGTLTLTGANTYSGGTALLGGAIAAGNNAALGTGTLGMANATTLRGVASSVTLSNAISLAAGLETFDTPGTGLRLNGVISGAGGINKTGTGHLVLAGADTYTGATIVNAGILTIAAGGSIAASSGVNLPFSGTLLDLTTAGNQTIRDLSGVTGSRVNLGANTLTEGTANSTVFAGIISGTGGLTKVGAGTLTLTGANTFTNGIALNAGTIAAGNNAALGTGSLTMTGGTTLQAAANVLSLANAIALTGAETVDTQADTLTLAGVISGAGRLTKIGAGTLVLAGANTYSGGTVLNAGVVQAGADNNLGAATGGLTFNGATLRFGAAFNLANTRAIVLNGAGGTFDTNTFNTTIAQAISGAGGLTKAGAGILTLTGVETFTGGVTIGGGTLALGAGGSLAAASGVNLGSGVTFSIAGGGNQTIRDLSGAGGSTVNFGANTLTEGTANATTFAGAIAGTGGLTKVGAGTLALTGASTYSGGTLLDAGIVAVGNNAALGTGTVTFNGGSLLATINPLSLANAFRFQAAGTIDTGANTLTLSGALSGAAALIKNGAGTLALTGNDSAYTGTATVNAGTLAVGVDAAPNTVFGGSVVANGGTVTGLGTIDGSLANPSGIVAPGGSIGTLTVRGNFNQGANGTFQVEVNPAAASLLQVAGAATLAGRLNVLYDPGVYASRNYTILTANSVTGTFATLTANGLPDGFAQSFVVDPTDVQLQLAAIVVPPTNDTVFTDATSIAVINGQRANSIILDRLGNRQAGIADGPLAAAAAPVQYAQAGTAAPLGAMASALPAIAEGAWFRGIGGFTSINGSATAPGFTGTAGGFIAGYDRPIAPNVYLGIAGGYSHSDVNEHSAANGRIDTGRVALYGGGWWQQNLLTATAGYAHDSISTDRSFAGVGTATESHGGNEATMAAQWSHPLDVDGFGGGIASITPKLGVQFLHLSEDSFSEIGAGGLNLSGASHSTDSLQPYVGLAASQKFITSDGTLITPELRLGYARETLSNSRLLTVTTVGGFNFPVVGVAPSRDNVTAGIGATMQAGAGLSFYGNYDTVLHTGNTTDHTVSAGLRIKF